MKFAATSCPYRSPLCHPPTTGTLPPACNQGTEFTTIIMSGIRIHWGPSSSAIRSSLLLCWLRVGQPLISMNILIYCGEVCLGELLKPCSSCTVQVEFLGTCWGGWVPYCRKESLIHSAHFWIIRLNCGHIRYLLLGMKVRWWCCSFRRICNHSMGAAEKVPNKNPKDVKNNKCEECWWPPSD